jgi:hypothetical protein
MSFERDHTRSPYATRSPAAGSDDHDIAPGKSSRSQRLRAPDQPIASGLLDVLESEPIQRTGEQAAPESLDDVRAAAARGIGSPTTALPYAEQIQASFGPDHDVSKIQAHVGGNSAEAMGATAFATGNHVVFDKPPDLHTAAHEAAHVVQQAHGVNLYGGVGRAGDSYEQHADAVADRVVAGKSAADLLGGPTNAGAHGGGVQRKPAPSVLGRASGPGMDDDDLAAALMQDVLVGMRAGKRLREQVLPAFSTLATGGQPTLGMPELEARSALREMKDALEHLAIYVEDPTRRRLLALPDEVTRGHDKLSHEYAELKARTDALSRQYAERVKAAQDTAKQPAVSSMPKGPTVPPHSYSQHVAAPPRFDFGKVSPGGVDRTEGAMFNLSSAQCGVQVMYSGSSAIHLVHQPTRLAAKGETWSLADQTIALQFNAPPTKGTHHGTVTVNVQWWGGPPADTLTIPVVAHSLSVSDDTPDEKIAREQRAKETADEAARIEKRDAKEKQELEKFEKQHPRVGTDEFDRQKEALWRVVSQFEQMQLSGVATAHDEVMKYVKRPPPAQDTRMFELAMLVLDIASAGIAGKLGKALELGLRTAGKDLAVELGKQIALSDSTVSLITDSVKESIKGSSKLARKIGLTPKAPRTGPAVGGNSTPAPGESADPRIAFFQYQRNGLINGESARTAGINGAVRLLMPTLHAKPELAYAAMKILTATYNALLVEASNNVAHESVRQWINNIADERLDIHHAGSVDSRPINQINGVIDIGFQAPYGPRSPIIVKQAIIRGVSNAVAHRFQNLRLGETGVPLRAYGLPGGNYAELPVAVLRGAGGHITWDDQTNGLAPASAATWIRQKGGAKQFMENEILGKSLTQHGIVLTTDQDPTLEGG